MLPTVSNLPLKALQGISSNLTAAKLWPSCVILSHFLLYHQNSIRGKNFFEFGSGYAVPSMVALRAGAKHAFLQELPIASLLEMQRQILLANGLEGSFDQVPFRWGQTLTDFHKTDHNIEFFIAADCIYDRQGIILSSF